MIFKKCYLAFSLVLLNTSILQPASAGAYVRIGFDGGGDKLDIPAVTDSEIKAGSGMKLEAGFVNMNSKNQLSGQSTELSFGVKFAEHLTRYESTLFSRLTLNATHFLHNGRWRFGAGVTYHFATTLHYENSFETDTDFDNTTGFTLQIDRMFYNGLYRVGIKGTVIEYQSEDAIDLDGSSIGIYAGAYF